LVTQKLSLNIAEQQETAASGTHSFKRDGMVVEFGFPNQYNLELPYPQLPCPQLSCPQLPCPQLPYNQDRVSPNSPSSSRSSICNKEHLS